MMSHRLSPLGLVVCAVLLCACLPAVAQEAQPAAPDSPGSPSVPAQLPGEPPALYLRGLSVQGPEARSALREQDLRKALEDWWEAHAASRLRLADPPPSSGGDTPLPGPSLSLYVRADAPGWVAGVFLVDRGGRRSESRTRVFSQAPRVLAQALGGEILSLWAQARGYPEAQYAPPRLTALLDLSTLSALDRGPGSESEPLDCAAGPGGPMLLYSDRTVGLGRRFGLTQESTRDLALRSPLPEGFIPSHLAVDPWGEAMVYGEGAVFRYEPEGTAAVRDPLPALGAQDAAGLAGGGIAVLSPGKASLFRRGPGELDSAELPLPSPFYVAMAADAHGALWLYDLEERKIRMVTGRAPAEGPEERGARQALVLEELGSVKPLASPEALPFPQVLRVFPDGGFVLGGAGELWRFDAAGWPLWRLRDFQAGVRQSLPAFYRIAVDGERAFYLLDPLSRRLLRFVDLDDSQAEPRAGSPAPRFATPPAAADVELAGLLRRWSEAAIAGGAANPDAGERERIALVEACRGRDLLLMARSLRAASPSAPAEEPAVLDRALRVKQARLLAELAGRYEEQLLLPVAEEAYNAALRILRALRSADPVDPEFPPRIRELERRRNAVREILIAVPPLELLKPVLSRPTGGAATATLGLQLRNTTAVALRELRFQVRVPGLPGGTLGAELPRLASRGTATLTAELATGSPRAGEPPPREDLPTRVLVLVTATVGNEERTFWLEAPIVVPAPMTASAPMTAFPEGP